jgi:hypothetical protein
LDTSALEALIAQKLRVEDIPMSQPLPLAPDRGDRLSGDVPLAAVTANLAGGKCLSTLKRLGVEFEVPDFETPHVETPILLSGPIAGVEILPRWPKVDRTQEVLDCRLGLALVGLSRVAAAQGVRKILYYSIYRPSPAGKPPKKGAQHPRGMAIDIGWLELRSGALVSVLDNFPHRRGQPICKQMDLDDAGNLLRQFVCQAHAEQLFQVMLTPNANADHQNHFHFDLTPEGSWCILQ